MTISIENDPTPDPSYLAALRNYEYLCLAALLILVLTQLLQDYGHWCMLSLLIGAGGVIGRWSTASIMLLLTPLMIAATHRASVLIVREVTGFGLPPVGGFSLGLRPEDWVQSAALLVYTAGHYRLLGLARMVLPEEVKQPGPLGAAPGGVGAPSHRPVRSAEFAGIVLAAAGWALVAQVVWAGLPDVVHEFPRLLDRMLVLIWMLAILVFVGAGMIGYQGREQSRPEAARMYLQDVLWKETRAEQRSMNRFVAWARLRYQRRKEGL
jgi:hypothetical protein